MGTPQYFPSSHLIQKNITLKPDGFYLKGSNTKIDGISECSVFLKRDNNLRNIPFLSYKCPKTNRSVFLECLRCYELGLKSKCQCSKPDRMFRQTLFLNEIAYAINNLGTFGDMGWITIVSYSYLLFRI